MIGFSLVYWITVRGEEQRSVFKFKEAYEDYVRNVPRFVPHATPYRHRANAAFAFHRVWGHGEHITILAIIALFLGLYLRQVLYQEHQSLTVSTVRLFLLMAGVILFLVLAIISRWLKGQKFGKAAL